MAFNLQAIVGATTVSLYDNNPFAILSARGFGGVPIRRVTTQGPVQHGDTDLGYRLNPRELELQIGFDAATDAALDTHRDTLVSIFKPLTSTPVYLRVTRDDGEIRQLDCYTVGDIKISLAPEFRPGHYHRATIKLRAPDPAYYGITPGTVTINGAGAGTAADWYLAGGLIGTARVLMSGGTPTQGQTWSYAGSISNATTYTLAFRATKEAFGATDKYAFYVDNTSGGEVDLTLRAGSVGNYYAGGTDVGAIWPLGSSFMTSGTGNYFVRHDPAGVVVDGLSTAADDAYNNILINDPNARPVGGATRRWRSDGSNTASSRWAGTILLYGLYSPGLTEAEISALGTYMSGAIGGTVMQTALVPYEGDLPEYPIITVRGPITALQIFNVLTENYQIAFGTNTIAAGETYVFDTRPGYKTITLGTVNKRSMLADYSDWDEFHLTSYIGGEVNPVVVTGTNTSGSTQISIVWYNRFASF